MATISLENVSKVFPGGTQAVDELDLEMEDGALTVVVGPSGSGKSTVLRMVAGLEAVTEGIVRIGDQVVNDLQPRKRDIAMVFQNYALYPHKSVLDNLSFALRMQRVPRAGRRRQATAVAKRLGIEELLDRRPSQLSGGQRQRVALGRAIIREPQAFLMDEPLSNLDAKLRVEMRAYITELQKELGTTTLYVTHDQTEALTMGDRVAVMRDGRLEQAAAPQELYDHPANLFVARFIGSPAMSVVKAAITREGDGLAVQLGDQRLALPPEVITQHTGLEERAGSEILFGVRPEALSIASSGQAAQHEGVLGLTAMRTELLGSDVLVHCDPGNTEAQAQPVPEDDGDNEPELSRWITARLPSGTPIAVGERVPLQVDLDRVHFFDCHTQQAVTRSVVLARSPLSVAG